MKEKLGEKVKHKSYHITQASPLPDIYLEKVEIQSTQKLIDKCLIATLVTKVKK